MVDQRRVRLSLKTRDLQRAARRLTEIEDRVSGKPRKTIVDAAGAFQAQHEGKAPETKRKYKRILGFLLDFLRQRLDPLLGPSECRNDGPLHNMADEVRLGLDQGSRAA